MRPLYLSGPEYTKLLDLATQLDAEWNRLNLSPTDKVMGFTRDNRAYQDGVNYGKQQMREAFLRANGLL
jgi:hypothetical protein